MLKEYRKDLLPIDDDKIPYRKKDSLKSEGRDRRSRYTLILKII